ncbi:hypothetical protein GCM10022226_13310 [Sphaerisporangium flaviroseum]|uniref:Uncharacterized protein n=1 Tax=Sphaerisporangium flaviroseum TaxID=509199 RepID=A0ABP7HR27_9ACTN
MLNLGTIATIAAIAAAKDADTLNTLALALAVIAFVCQLIIYGIQTWQHDGQSQQENRLTLEKLAEACTQIDAACKVIQAQHTKFLLLKHSSSQELRSETGLYSVSASETLD